MTHEWVPNYEFDLNKLNVLTLTREVDCLIVIEECKNSIDRINRDISLNMRGQDWKTSAILVREGFEHKMRLVELKLKDIQAKEEKKAKKEREFQESHSAGREEYPANVMSAIRFKKVARAMLPSADYEKIDGLSSSLVSTITFAPDTKQQESNKTNE